MVQNTALLHDYKTSCVLKMVQMKNKKEQNYNFSHYKWQYCHNYLLFKQQLINKMDQCIQ